MRSWRGAGSPEERVYLYFRAHPNNFFTPEHVASQVKMARRAARRIITELELMGKLEGVNTVSSYRWGRPRKMWRSTRGQATAHDSLQQLEAFRHAVKFSGLTPEQLAAEGEVVQCPLPLHH